MARKLRLEFPGACYHGINRGNYRTDIFQAEKTKAAFEQCLFAACAKSGWRLHAFVIMRHHCHLAVETPQGNLVPGMQWLQTAFVKDHALAATVRAWEAQGAREIREKNWEDLFQSALRTVDAPKAKSSGAQNQLRGKWRSRCFRRSARKRPTAGSRVA